MDPWIGAGHQKHQTMSRSFRTTPNSPEREEGPEKVNDQLCLGNEDSIKIPKVWGL